MTRPVRPVALVILTVAMVYPGVTLLFQGGYPFINGDYFNLVGSYGPWASFFGRFGVRRQRRAQERLRRRGRRAVPGDQCHPQAGTRLPAGWFAGMAFRTSPGSTRAGARCPILRPSVKSFQAPGSAEVTPDISMGMFVMGPADDHAAGPEGR